MQSRSMFFVDMSLLMTNALCVGLGAREVA